MAKTITISYKDNDYTLEFTRDSVRTMETGGFDITKVDSMPVTMIPKFIFGAFRANHPSVKMDKVNEIYKTIKNKEQFIKLLGEMYQETVETLTTDDENSEGNSDWKASW